MMNLVSVVIPATAYDFDLKKCLESIVAQKNVSLEVWVVFNPKTPAFDQTIWPSWIQFIESPKGANYARNLGMRKSTSDFVFFLDSDCELIEENHIKNILGFLLIHSHAAGVGGGYIIADSANLPTKAYHYLQMNWLRMQIKNTEFGAQALIGGHMLLRKSMLRGQEFDESMVFGGTEREFFLRLQNTDAQFFLNLKINVLHNARISGKQLMIKAKVQGIGEKYILTKKYVNPANNDIFCLAQPVQDVGCMNYIKQYNQTFARFAGSMQRKSFFSQLLFKLSEHLHVAQSNRY